MLAKAARFINILRWLSLDIVAACVLLLHFVSSQFIEQVPIPVYVTMGISVWMIYTIDHIRDGLKNPNPTLNRHQFHRRYKNGIVVLAIIMLSIGIWTVTQLSLNVVVLGTLLSLLAGLYLLFESTLGRFGSKELIIAVVFGLGIFLYPFSQSKLGVEDFVLLGQLILLAFINLVIISYFEWVSDTKDQNHSFVTKYGPEISQKVALILSVLSILCSLVMMAFGGFPEIQFFYLTASTIFMVIAHRPHLFQQNERYRILGDGVFFIPLVLL